MTPAALVLMTLAATVPPAPHVTVGDALPAGAVARLGPTAFRHGYSLSVLYSPDGRRLAVGSIRHGVWVFDAATGRRLALVAAPGNGGDARLLGWDAGGNVVVICRHYNVANGTGVFAVDPASGAVRRAWRPAGPERGVHAISPDGRVVYTTTRYGFDKPNDTIADDVVTGRELWRRRGSWTVQVKASPDGTRLVEVGIQQKDHASTLRVLDAATGAVGRQFTVPAWFESVAVGPRADRVAVLNHAGFRNRAELLVFAAGPGAAYKAPGEGYSQVFFRPDGRHAVSIHRRGELTAEVWDLADGKGVTRAPAGPVGVAGLSPDGKTLAVVADGGVRFADVDTGAPLPHPADGDPGAYGVWYLPDGRLASTGAQANPVVWDEKAGTVSPLPAESKPAVVPLPADFRLPDQVRDTVASPRGDRALASLDVLEGFTDPGGLVLVAPDASIVARYPYPDNDTTYTFAADGKSFAVARGDGSVTAYDAKTGFTKATFRHPGPTTGLAVSPDGKRAAVACPDGPILVFAVGR